MSEKRRIKVSEKRQITIPIRFFEQLQIKNEVEAFVEKGKLVIQPVEEEDYVDFSVDILKDLISQGYQGQELLEQFVFEKSQIRVAVENMLVEAEEVAKEARKHPERNKTAEIFADLLEDNSCIE